jgi:hypothetical protein
VINTGRHQVQEQNEGCYLNENMFSELVK